jgi:hypothetical protein
MKFKFHIVPSGHPKLRYQHEVVSICEGLRSLGHEYYGSCNYWMEPETGKYLVQQAPPGFEAEVHVYNTYYFDAFPEKIKEADYSKINILIDREDGLYGAYGHPQFRKFNLILRTHYNKQINYGYYNPHIRPWAFGLSDRIIRTIDQSSKEEILNRVLISFRISHDLRGAAVEKMSPVLKRKYEIFNGATDHFALADPAKLTDADKIYAEQSGKRHDPVYYQKLNSSLLTYSFGGFLCPRPFATNRINKQFQQGYKLASAILKKFNRDDSGCYFINQFDSWRLWESFYSRTCPIHMDFEDWDFVLPVMPVNKVHYWGVKRFQFEQSAEELLALHRDDILQIGENGRKWSLENYGPIAVAERFVNTIEEIDSRK